jgi:D-galactarolactone cycloisomerase
VQTHLDSTKVGGLTESWRIAWMAYEHNIQWVPHGWNTAIRLAADVHPSAAMPVARYVEYLTPSPYLEQIIMQPFRSDAEGYLTIPDKPGLGIELNWEALKRFGG